MSSVSLAVMVRQIRWESADIVSLELTPVEGTQLPAAQAGDHIDIELPGGLRRSYSLLDAQERPACYRIAVKREADSKGGSRWFHQTARVGAQLRISAPLNNFPLFGDAPHSILIAGGIGITPMLSMMQALNAMHKAWTLYYSARDDHPLAFEQMLTSLERAGSGRIHRHNSRQSGRLDLQHIIDSAAEGTHFYCCGPSGMIDSFLASTQTLAPARVHYERFSSSRPAALAGGFELLLARSGQRLAVHEGQSILDVLLDAGIDAPYACAQGLCGTCKIDVLSGIPDHRDDCLSDEERSSGNCIIACCSGSRSPVLEIDL